MNGTGSFQPTYSSLTNRFASLPGFTPVYDLNGNLLSDSAHTYTWTIDGRPATIDSVSITYDALGRMVEQARSGAYTQVVYTPTGSKLALMNSQTLNKAFVALPSGGTAVYTSAGLSYYRHADWLGTSRLASTPSRTVYSDSAYSPFGQSYAQSGSTDAVFTGQNQDTVPGIYDFPAREYAPFQGRWVSPDPSGIQSVNPLNPKTWNRYAYTLDNPLSMVDPNGECSEPKGLQPGQIGVCIDLYIAGPTIGIHDCPFLCGLGDNRGPVGNDPDATYRVEYQLIYDPQNDFVTRTVITHPSEVEIEGLIASSTGDTTGDITATANSDGSVSVSIDTSSINGFDFIPGAPHDPILLDTSLTFSPDGTVSIDGGERSGFPSIEVWSYQSGQDPYNLLSMQETKESDLGSFNQEIPNVSNDPSSGSAFVTGADGSDNGGDGGGGGGGGGEGFDDQQVESEFVTSLLCPSVTPSREFQLRIALWGSCRPWIPSSVGHRLLQRAISSTSEATVMF
jgi:RHS repeat-associated protein